MGQLKSKERIVSERYEESKKNNVVLKEIAVKEKALNEKIRVFERREKEIKGKEN